MVLIRLSLSMAMLFVIATTTCAEPWSERLGFPAGRKVVILQARELGLTWEFSEASKRLLESGQVSSASVVVTGPRFNDIAKWRRANPAGDVGLSIALH